MNVEKELITKTFDEETANFLDSQFGHTSDYGFINKYVNNLKKQVNLAISIEQLSENEITPEEFEGSLKTEVEIKANYKGYFVRGSISDFKFYELLAFFGCNNNPRVDATNNALLFNSKHHRLFVSDFNSDTKSIALLYKKQEVSTDISMLFSAYFSKIEETKEMSETDVVKLSYDISDLDYKKDYTDFNTNANLFNVQDSLLQTYQYNPVDYLLTLGLIYRLRVLGWNKDYIDYIASNNRGFNILNSNSHVIINKIYIQYLIESGYIDGSDYSITDNGRTALLLLNYITPMKANNISNFFTPIEYIVSSQKTDKKNIISINIDNTVLYGIRDEFFVDEKCLSSMSKGMFGSDSSYNSAVLNSVNRLDKGRMMGYSSNITVSNTKSLEFEICQQLFNTFNDDFLNIIGGLIAIRPYKSTETVFVNSLVYKLISRVHRHLIPYISSSDSSYVVFKDENTGNIAGVIKSKNFSCQKEIIGTYDLNILKEKLSKNYLGKLTDGLNVAENIPSIVGVGFIEKAELSSEDFKKLLSVPFKDLKNILRTINKDSYFNDLDESSVITKIINERKSDYETFTKSIKEEMSKKLKALELINEYYVETQNNEKVQYYLDLIDDFTNKINNFQI